MRRSMKQSAEIQREIQHLNRENQKLQNRVHSLKSDPAAIERIAREDMGLARPGEYIFKIQPKPGEPTTLSPSPPKRPRSPNSRDLQAPLSSGSGACHRTRRAGSISVRCTEQLTRILRRSAPLDPFVRVRPIDKQHHRNENNPPVRASPSESFASASSRLRIFRTQTRCAPNRPAETSCPICDQRAEPPARPAPAAPRVSSSRRSSAGRPRAPGKNSDWCANSRRRHTDASAGRRARSINRKARFPPRPRSPSPLPDLPWPSR